VCSSDLPELANSMLLAVTEMSRREVMDAVAEVLRNE
jgi:hypothetical protein